MTNQLVRIATKRVVELLVAKRYDELAQLTNDNRLTSGMIAAAIRDYGRELVLPPDSVYESLNVIEVVNSVPQRWSVYCDLWTEQEGRSDLTLELTIVVVNGNYRVELDDIHVL